MTRWLNKNLPPFLWAFLIFLGSSWPAARVSANPVLDFLAHKVVHLLEYGVLYLLYYRSLVNDFWQYQKIPVLLSLLLVTFFGGADEYHQSFVDGRTGRARDVLVDFLGGILAFLLWRFLRQKRRPKPTE